MISERDVIYITKKQASIAVVTLAIFCTLMFMLGYFWGKQCVLEGFGQRITQESMNDQADYESMMQQFVDKAKVESFSERSDLVDEPLQSNQASKNKSLTRVTAQDEFSEVEDQFEPALEKTTPAQLSTKPAQNKNKENKVSTPLLSKNSSSNKNQNKAAVDQAPKKWSAILVGFATKQHALGFVQRLHNRGIAVHIKTRISKSATGKTQKIWFQVVTSSFDSKEKLDEEIAQIKKTERIKSSDIKIIQ